MTALCVWLLFSLMAYGLYHGYFCDIGDDGRIFPLFISLIGGPFAFLCAIALNLFNDISDIKFKL